MFSGGPFCFFVGKFIPEKYSYSLDAWVGGPWEQGFYCGQRGNAHCRCTKREVYVFGECNYVCIRGTGKLFSKRLMPTYDYWTRAHFASPSPPLYLDFRIEIDYRLNTSLLEKKSSAQAKRPFLLFGPPHPPYKLEIRQRVVFRKPQMDCPSDGFASSGLQFSENCYSIFENGDDSKFYKK